MSEEIIARIVWSVILGSIFVFACICFFVSRREFNRPVKAIRIRGEKLLITYEYKAANGDIKTYTSKILPDLSFYHEGSSLTKSLYSVIRPTHWLRKEPLHVKNNTTIPYHQITKIDYRYAEHEFDTEVQLPCFGEKVYVNSYKHPEPLDFSLKHYVINCVKN